MNTQKLVIKGQSAALKTSSTGSKDTGIFIPQDIKDFLGFDNKIAFRVYKSDCVQAMENIVKSLPLYSNKGGKRIEHSDFYKECNRYMTMIESFFGENDSALYLGSPMNYSLTTQDRTYIYGLDQDGFSIRDFFVADHSIVTFQKDELGNVDLRFVTCLDINSEDGLSSLPDGNQSLSTTPSNMPFLPALRTKPFLLLAGISGTGKSRLVRKLAQASTTMELQQKYNKGWDSSNFDTVRWTLHRPENFELIQVKPNWHNSMDVVGYMSNIPTPHYVFTPFIRFVAKAWQNPEVPFFLCLDEMNLAPVEEYFAEFLSAIESRSKDESGYITDPIVQPFDSFGSIGDTMINELFPEFSAADVGKELSNVVAHFKTKGVTLPENLMVIGTVNMDETTFSFSRKVLDRAMSIEMNEVDYDAFLNDSTDQAMQAMLKEIGSDRLNDLLVNRHVSALEADVDPEGKDEVISYLKRINLLLDGTPFKLGYRAANEALIYVQAAKDFGMNNWQAAMDEFTLMKILSRLEGDEAKLTVLEGEKRLVNAELDDNEYIKQGGRATLLSCLREIIRQTLGEDDSCRSIAKLDSMIEQLRREHFVSYWN